MNDERPLPSPDRPTRLRERLRRESLRRLRRRRRRAGMTLVEIMIVVIIMALIATGVAVAVLPQLERARAETTETRASTIRSAAENYVALSPGADCPDIDTLLDEGEIRGDVTDGWGNAYDIRCEGVEIIVTSPRFNGETVIEEGAGE